MWSWKKRYDHQESAPSEGYLDLVSSPRGFSVGRIFGGGTWCLCDAVASDCGGDSTRGGVRQFNMSLFDSWYGRAYTLFHMRPCGLGYGSPFVMRLFQCWYWAYAFFVVMCGASGNEQGLCPRWCLILLWSLCVGCLIDDSNPMRLFCTTVVFGKRLERFFFSPSSKSR